MLYDGVKVKELERDERGDILLEVTDKAPWPDSPDVGAYFWIKPDDKYLVETSSAIG